MIIKHSLGHAHLFSVNVLIEFTLSKSVCHFKACLIHKQIISFMLSLLHVFEAHQLKRFHARAAPFKQERGWFQFSTHCHKIKRSKRCEFNAFSQPMYQSMFKRDPRMRFIRNASQKTCRDSVYINLSSFCKTCTLVLNRS